MAAILRSLSARDDVNLKLYQRSDIVKSYATATLHPPEATILVRYREDFLNRRVLDLGCGAGRLTTYLRPLTDRYTGVDFSPQMVAHCRRQFPELVFRQADMRDLTQFECSSFDTVVAIYNMFDPVSHEDRLRVLGQVRRILTANGLLVFSAHNLNCVKGIGAPRLHFTLNPYSQWRNIVDYASSVANRLRIKPEERLEQDYALLNDCAHNYSLLHYYIRRQTQAEQLAGAGFGLLECLDHLGRTLAPGADDGDCASIYYVARVTP